MGGCGASRKGRGKGAKNDKGKGGKKAAGSSAGKGGGDTLGQSIAKLAKERAPKTKGFTRLEKLMEKALIGSTDKSKNKDMWTCGLCGDDRCFASKVTCHKCNTPKGRPPGPPAVAKAAKQLASTADPIEVQEPVEETTLEDQILEL